MPVVQAAGSGFMKGLMRAVTSASSFIANFTNNGKARSRVAFAAPYPGKIIPLNMTAMGGSFICQKNSFLCTAKGIDIQVAFTKNLGAGLFLATLTGPGQGLSAKPAAGAAGRPYHCCGPFLARSLEAL